MPHDVWNYTQSRHLYMLQELSNLFARHFPNKTVIAAVGNHEGVPCDSFPPRYVPVRFSNQWLYDRLEKQWKRWAPLSDSEQANVKE